MLLPLFAQSTPLHDIEARLQRVVQVAARTLLPVEPGPLSAADLAPGPRDDRAHFHYRYRLLSPHWPALPLVLRYTDGHIGQRLGHGWQLALELDYEQPLALDLLVMDWPAERFDGRDWVVVQDRVVPLSAPGADVATRISEADRHGVRWQFSLRPGASPRYRLHAAQFADGTTLELQRDPQGQLQSLRQSDRVLALAFAQGPERLSRLAYQHADAPGHVWTLRYQGADAQPLLAAISLPMAGQLQFRYGIRESGPTATASGTASPAPGSYWQRVDDDLRFRLPDDLSISQAPDLLFLDLDRDHRFDLVRGKEGQLKSWLWRPQGWQAFRYVPAHAVHSRQGLPLGATLLPLPARFFDDSRNTDQFQSLLVSSYRPGPDSNGLQYTHQFCHPNVRHDQLDPALPAWRCMDDARLRLPVPLQYEGLQAWPLEDPQGRVAVESTRNQGALLRDLDGNGYLDLWYIGLHYRDSAGRDLFGSAVPHRQRHAQNCAPHFQTQWNGRAVHGWLCQAWWEAREPAWIENYTDLHGQKPFWVRKDLDRQGLPTGRYTIPWQSIAGLLAHVRGFHNVQFARLADGPYAGMVVIAGTARTVGPPEDLRPEARLVLGLRPGAQRWEPLAPQHAWLPPDAFFSSRRGRFVDLDGDGLDDAVIADGQGHTAPRAVWRNSAGQPRWVSSPGWHFPPECSLSDGACRVEDLDADGRPDLLLGRGKTVYLNRGPVPQFRRPVMTAYTDAAGRQRLVDRGWSAQPLPTGGNRSTP